MQVLVEAQELETAVSLWTLMLGSQVEASTRAPSTQSLSFLSCSLLTESSKEAIVLQTFLLKSCIFQEKSFGAFQRTYRTASPWPIFTKYKHCVIGCFSGPKSTLRLSVTRVWLGIFSRPSKHLMKALAPWGPTSLLREDEGAHSLAYSI